MSGMMIAIGGVALLLIVIIVVFVFSRKKGNKQQIVSKKKATVERPNFNRITFTLNQFSNNEEAVFAQAKELKQLPSDDTENFDGAPIDMDSVGGNLIGAGRM
eukprot:GAHX01000162.1.p2 GENE.GAHX01000162.1~~GAHX01000162.1.p2  ORF type:complete len:103 (+),score=19.74 GAHX01000162.1:59-367(+)